MRPNKIGSVAKFHTPLPGENLDQLNVVLEIIEDDERPRVDIKALNKGLPFPPINTVKLDDLKVVEVDATDLVEHNATINKAEYSEATGKVGKVSEKKIMLDLTKGIKGVETNVWLTIEDENEKQHTVALFVN
jgi:hypothetical protein